MLLTSMLSRHNYCDVCMMLWLIAHIILLYCANTNRILSRGKELTPLILNGNAHIYICGDGNQMSKDVIRALVSVLHQHGDLSEESAQEILDDMRSRRRLLMDVWS
jgi:hypothetical protein